MKMATVNDQLTAALKAQEEANKRVEEIKKQSREADLQIVKDLIKAHGFGPTDLRGVLKAKRKRTVVAKKTTGSTRKSTTTKKK